jgi:FkbM family methyltransferase
VLQDVIHFLYYGQLRYPFRALMRRFLRDNPMIQLGSLRGLYFNSEDLPYRLGIYELHIQRLLAQHVKESDVFYDVGANRGFISLLASRLVGSEGRVYSFEPLPDNIVQFRDLMARNQVNNVSLIQAAVSARRGKAHLFSSGDSSTASLVSGKRKVSREVQVVTLDGFCLEHPAPTFIKIDVEGAESEVVAGTANLLASSQPLKILVELHDREQEESVTAMLHEHHLIMQEIPAMPRRMGGFPKHILARRQVLS